VNRSAEEQFPSASVIKLAILVELFAQAHEGRARLDETRTLREEEKVDGSGVLKELRAPLDLMLEDLARLMIVISDNTASNMCGFTLMNNQVGAVMAQVLSKLPNVKVTPLPSMIRVDGINRMDFDYDEISEALGEEQGYYDAAQFEENMSTHYGRMIHEDDRTIMFANPEDAAEYIGFDLPTFEKKN
jgi:propane monooxygenase coupling protein